MFFEARLQEAATTTAAVVVGFIGVHLRNVFLTHRLGNCKPEVVCNFVAEAFTYNLAGILNSELNFQVLVPVRIGLQFTLPNPLGIVFIDVLGFEVVSYVESFQSGPDCKCYVASLRIKIGLAFQLVGHFGLRPHQFLPILFIC